MCIIYIFYILARLGCHLVEEILQYVHFNIEQVSKMHMSLVNCLWGCLEKRSEIVWWP